MFRAVKLAVASKNSIAALQVVKQTSLLYTNRRPLILQQRANSLLTSDVGQSDCSTQAPDTNEDRPSFAALLSLSKSDPTFATRLTKVISQSSDSDPELRKVFDFLEKGNVKKIDTKTVITILRTINEAVGPSQSLESEAVRRLENSLIWRTRYSSLWSLIALLNFSASYCANSSPEPIFRSTDLRDTLLREVVLNIEKRLSDINDAGPIIAILQHSSLFSSPFLVGVEDKILELASTFSAAELTQLLKQYVSNKKRPFSVLMTICHFLRELRPSLDLKRATDIIHCLNVLSVKDKNMLEFFCAVVSDRLEQAITGKSAWLRSLLISLGQLKFRDDNLLNAISAKMSSGDVQLGVKDLVAFLVTTANLNYVPCHSDALYDKIATQLSADSLPSDRLWLNVVWSLAALRKLDRAKLRSVLCDEFINRLLDAKDLDLGPACQLLNLIAVGRFEFSPPIEVQMVPVLEQLANKVKDDLGRRQHPQGLTIRGVTEFFHRKGSSPDQYEVNVPTNMGFSIDVEAIVDPSLRLLPIRQYQRPPLDGRAPDEHGQPLPAGASRIAVLTVRFRDQLMSNRSGSNDISGLTALQIRLLEANGYKVLVVNDSDLKDNTLSSDWLSTRLSCLVRGPPQISH